MAQDAMVGGRMLEVTHTHRRIGSGIPYFNGKKKVETKSESQYNSIEGQISARKRRGKTRFCGTKRKRKGIQFTESCTFSRDTGSSARESSLFGKAQNFIKSALALQQSVKQLFRAVASKELKSLLTRFNGPTKKYNRPKYRSHLLWGNSQATEEMVDGAFKN